VKKHRVPVAAPPVALKMVLADKVRELCSDAGAQPFGHCYQARRPVRPYGKKRRDSYMADRLAAGQRLTKYSAATGLEEVLNSNPPAELGAERKIKEASKILSSRKCGY
jgi:hypothetical protein